MARLGGWCVVVCTCTTRTTTTLVQTTYLQLAPVFGCQPNRRSSKSASKDAATQHEKEPQKAPPVVALQVLCMPVELIQHGAIAKAHVGIPKGHERGVKARLAATALPHALGCSIRHGNDNLLGAWVFEEVLDDPLSWCPSPTAMTVFARLQQCLLGHPKALPLYGRTRYPPAPAPGPPRPPAP